MFALLSAATAARVCARFPPPPPPPPPPRPPPLDYRDISLSVDGKPILQPISLTLHAGRLLGVLGPSGSGKSSLLCALSGAYPAARAVRLRGCGHAFCEPCLARHAQLRVRDGGGGGGGGGALVRCPAVGCASELAALHMAVPRR